MPWIRTVLPEDDPRVGDAMGRQRVLYPAEYAEPVHQLEEGLPGIVASHTLIPDALYHAFSTFGALMSPSLPLGRRQHEMIATMVSLTNACHY
ncbi:hypothetical protein OJF2_04460 [Aquisphaera giovannonii]|uniref:Carboxymuconolactone decarboxylase-like domain-containing protein n=1 Tax=Aquisphaera giovannonii TaxID=406548 RepID=A0A5B9VV27_9BACT|nr:hypothetical protein [Aquisphaera giovannonii]QEH31979.1 hypothetical protein OJF2_04460 [Aquisphaera giovannonii]